MRSPWGSHSRKQHLIQTKFWPNFMEVLKQYMGGPFISQALNTALALLIALAHNRCYRGKQRENKAVQE